MSEENKDLGDEIKDTAKDVANEAKDVASDVADEAKDVANDLKESWNEATSSSENKKMIAAILAIVIGSLGIHKFILGYTKEGIIQIVITIITCGAGGIIGLIEGIIYLTKSDEEFYQTYQVGKKGWF